MGMIVLASHSLAGLWIPAAELVADVRRGIDHG